MSLKKLNVRCNRFTKHLRVYILNMSKNRNQKQKPVYVVKGSQPPVRRNKKKNKQQGRKGSRNNQFYDKSVVMAGRLFDKYTGGVPRRVMNSIGNFITGSGDYTVRSNNLITSSGSMVPQFLGYNRAIQICHKEYIMDVDSSTNFVNNTFSINPGISETFPWLSVIAANFQQYRIRGMVYYFKSTSANALNSTNTALGTMIMSTQYDSQATPFTSKVQMENYEFCTSCKPSEDMMHPIECARGDTPIVELYVRTGSIPDNADIRLYDLGVFQLASVGSQATANVGELWVSYCIDLLKPALVGGQFGADNLTSHYQIPVTGITTSAYFGSTLPLSTSYESGSNIALSFTNNTISFPDDISSGTYILDLVYIGSSSTLTSKLAIGTLVGCVGVELFPGSGAEDGSTQLVYAPNATTSTTLGLKFCFALTSASASIQIIGGTMPSSLSSADLFVCAINSNIIS